MPERSHLPRVLIVDDDPVTLRFFEGALTRLADCVVAIDAAAALTHSEANTFDLFIVDLNLPDMRGEQLLNRLRILHPSTRAIATSADVDAVVRKRTLAHGFDGIIEKPIALDALMTAVNKHLHRGDASTLLDDAVALQSLGGDRTSLTALRGLLVVELEAIYADTATFDRDELVARLHRLRASCGFCGATALASAAASLQQSLQASALVDRAAVDRFFELCGATATALRS
jgi:two-component system OmpR family response regulator